jgi:hypothetical protein
LYLADSFNDRVRRIQPSQIGSGVNPGTVQVLPGVTVAFGAATLGGGSLMATASLNGATGSYNFDLGPAGNQLFYNILYTGTAGGPFTVNIFFDSKFASCTGLTLTQFTAAAPCNTGCNVTSACDNVNHIITGQVPRF